MTIKLRVSLEDYIGDTLLVAVKEEGGGSEALSKIQLRHEANSKQNA